MKNMYNAWRRLKPSFEYINSLVVLFIWMITRAVQGRQEGERIGSDLLKLLIWTLSTRLFEKEIVFKLTEISIISKVFYTFFPNLSDDIGFSENIHRTYVVAFDM